MTEGSQATTVYGCCQQLGSSSLISWIVSKEGQGISFDNRWKEYTGLTTNERPGERWRLPFHPDDIASSSPVWRASFESREACEVKARLRDAKGIYRWWSIGMLPLIDESGALRKWLFFGVDIHSVKEMEMALYSSLRKNRALIGEVQHRVLNNLQVISSLLRLEVNRSEGGDVKHVLAHLLGRVQSMALLHQFVFQRNTFPSVDLGAYLSRLATQIFRTRSVTSRIMLKVNCETVYVGLDHAGPCGLVLYELLTNAIVHGFRENRDGEVCVEFHPEPGTGTWCLRVSDTGWGLPADFEARRERALGLTLVSDLANQLDGQFEFGSRGEFSVTFKVIELAP